MIITDRVNLPEVSGGYSNSKIIRTGNGVFHTGMTLDEARMIGRDKCVLRRDFSNIDKNKDLIFERLKWLRDDKQLDLEQLYWYYKKYEGYIDKRLIQQEYPCSPKEAFLLSGQTVFDTEILRQ